MAIQSRTGNWLLALVATALLVVGCGGGDLSQAAPETLAAADETPVVIDWFVGLGTGSQRAQVDAQRDLVDAFNETNDDIRINLEIVDQRLAFDLLRERIEAGEAPDIVGPVGIRGANEFAGDFLDLTDYVDDELLAQYDPEQVEVYSRDGRVEALPFGVFPSMIYFNREVFDEAGLPYPPAEFGGTYRGQPWDMDALTQLATDLTLDVNGNTAASPDFDQDVTVQWGFAHQWMTDPRSHASFFGAGSLVAEDGTAQIPESWEAEWEWLHTATHELHIAPSPEEIGTDLLDNGNSFASGRLAMAFSHLWYVGSINDPEGNPLQSWDLAATPSFNGEITAKLHADTFRIMADSEHPDEAFEVLTFLLGDGAVPLLQAYSSFPARLDLREEFFDGLAEQHPHVENWTVVSDALSYPDIPSHEAMLPGGEATQELLDQFGNELLGDPGLEVDVRVAQLREDLDEVFSATGS